MKIYFDTSAFVKRYIQESHSEKIESICQEASAIALSVISVTEFFSTISRLKREKKLKTPQYTAIKQAFLEELPDIHLCSVTENVIYSSVDILESHSLKTLDALQIACSLDWESDCFVSADQKQLTIAKQLGLKIIHL